MQRSSGLRVTLLYVWAVLLTATTTILGAAPLKALRTRMGAGPFWLITFGFVSLMWGLKMPWAAGALAAVTILIGVYSEFEERGSTVAQAGAFSLTSTVLGLSGIFYFWALSVGKGWRAEVLAFVEKLLVDAHQLGLPASEALTAENLALQAPSLLIAILALSLMFSLVLERPFSHWLNLPFRRREKLSSFRVPDVLIWPTIVSLLFAFGKFDNRWAEVLGLNVLNVCGLLYFFQGLAILAKYFEVFRVGAFWRVIWVILLAIQLPLVLGVVGLADYWVDFRKYFRKKASELQKKRVEE